MKGSRLIWWSFYLILLTFALAFLFAGLDLIRTVIGLVLVIVAGAMMAVLPRLFHPDVTEARIAQTYGLEVPALNVEPIRLFPRYRVPPGTPGEDRARVRFGCAPLLDCCFPLIVRELYPVTWDQLARSHAIDVQFVVTPFNTLFQSVERGDPPPPNIPQADIVIASAIAVDRAMFSGFLHIRRNPNSPLALLPVLQKFNAYYIFAKREPLAAHLNTSNVADPSFLNRIGRNSSLHEVLLAGARPGPTSNVVIPMTPNLILNKILRETRLLVETGADLDAAIISYWEQLNPGKQSAPMLNFNATKHDNSIQETFQEFLQSEGLALYLGGLAQAAYLLDHADINGDYVVVAGPRDINFDNINSVICTKTFAEEHHNDLLRFYMWWFDVVDAFRRELLFTPSSYQKLSEILRRGLRGSADELVKVLPLGSTDNAIGQLLEFLKCTDPEAMTKFDQVGNFLFPNVEQAMSVTSEILNELQRNDAIIDLLPNIGNESLSEIQSGVRVARAR